MSPAHGRSADGGRRRPSLRRAVLAVGEWTAPRKWRLVGVMLLLVFYGALWVGYAAGATALLGPLVVAPALVFLVAAGNLLQGWLGIGHRAPQFARPNRADDEQGDEAAAAP